MPTLDRLRPQPDARLHFLRGFLDKPQQVGSIIPSSRFLERRLVALAEVEHAESVVELGPGTGGTTRAMLRAMSPDAKLLAIELNERFARLLERETDPRLVVHRGSASDLREILAEREICAPHAVVSGIPFSTIGRERGTEIIRAVHDVLVPGGIFLAYQVRDRVGEFGREVFGAPEVAREFRNIPPLVIFRWRKHARQGVASGSPR